MTVQVKKTYRGLNPEMLYDEVRDLAARRGLITDHVPMQTYSISSGATQSRVTAQFRTQDKRPCGSLHVLGTAGGDARMTLEMDDATLSAETMQLLRDDIDFMLGSYEVKW